MRLAVHVDKVVFILLLALTIWYAATRFRGIEDDSVARDLDVERARHLGRLVEKISIPSPARDPKKFSGAPKLQWERIPWVVSLNPMHFYPKAKRSR